MLFFTVLILVCIFGPVICKLEEKARKAEEERTEQARQEAARRAARDKANFAAAQAKAKADAAAARKEDQQRKKAERETEQRKKQAEKLEAARRLAEYRERALKAEKELRALQTGARTTKAPAKKPEEAPAKKPVEKPAPDPEQKPANAPKSFPQKFTGEAVAFTGTLPTMTRKEAIQATEKRGGRAFETINTKCTLLVIGERPGKQQLERAATWNIQTITWEEWFQQAEISWRMRKYCAAMAAEKGWKRPNAA